MACVHDLYCHGCGRPERNHYFSSISDVDAPPACPSCGGERVIWFNPSYGRTFGGSFTGLSSEKITVWAHPDGRVAYPGRNDQPLPDRYRRQGYERRELAPFEVSAFERDNHVAVESLHWNRNGKADRDDPPPPPPKVEYSDLTSA